MITSVSTLAVAEGETEIATLTATDSDSTVGELTWTKTGGADSSNFTLSSAGVLAFVVAKDYETPDDADGDGTYQVEVQVSDGSNSATAALAVALENVIELTELTGSTAVSYEENQAVRVAAYTASSEQDHDGLSWSLSGADAASFSIDDPWGVLRFDPAPVSPNLFPAQPDYESPADADGDGVYEVAVEVGDGAATHTLSMEVTISDQDEPGTLTLSTTGPLLGEELTATISDQDGVTGVVTYAWERSAGRNAWVVIADATAASYTPTAAVTGHFLRVAASYTDGQAAGQTATAMSSEVVAGPLLSSLSATTNDSDLGVGWRQMKPAFDPRTLHYAVGCKDVDTMSLTFSAQDGGSRLAVESAQVTNSGAGMATTAEETVYYGATVRVMVAGADGGTTTYVVHCIPAGMDKVTTVKRATSGVTEDLIMFARREQQHVYMLMIDNNGVPRYIRTVSSKGAGPYFNWTRLADTGEWRYTYGRYGDPDGAMVVLDQDLRVLDTVQTVAPLTTMNKHHHLILEDGNYLMLGYEPATRDFSYLSFGDYSDAEEVEDSTIQISTPDGEAVFTWTSFGKMALEDCHPQQTDYAHVNSLQMVEGGDIIASFRSCEKVLRIDPDLTDDHKVVWRVGATNLNDEEWEALDIGPPPMKIIGDPEGEFAGQHAAWLLPNGNLLMFDNGGPTQINPWTGKRKRRNLEFARGVEYAIDAANGEAIFLRDHALHGKRSLITAPGGNIDPLANGDWLISWGNGQKDPPADRRVDEAMTQVDPRTRERRSWRSSCWTTKAPGKSGGGSRMGCAARRSVRWRWRTCRSRWAPKS